ncbi:hypothetical protein C2G38_2182199 [Gigaspora rosea]|uniref:Uncharacterized protein n=1 Tax=Gigaspora rosea TaxID=44941 RepID=A0A397VBW6_9GLOM|nr:hypothetical protein C2G38_2182199 [Gigaspora rosea]
MAKPRAEKTTNTRRSKKKEITELSDEETSGQQAISNKRLRQTIYENDKSNELACIPFEPMNLNNAVPIPTNNLNFIKSNLTYNTHSSNKNINRLQGPFNDKNNSEDRFMISENSIISEQQYKNKDSLWQQTSYINHKENNLKSNLQPQYTSHSRVNSYNAQRLDKNNNLKELNFLDEQSLVNWLCTRPDLITQVQSLTSSVSNKTEVNLLEPTDKEIIINLVMEQCKLLFLCTQNPTRKIHEKLIKKIVLSMDPLSKEFKMLYRKTHEYFDNFRCTFNKDMVTLAKDLLVKNCDSTDENIEQFVASRVWRQKLSKYLEASNFSEFKKSQSSLKSLENFIVESLKIHIDYQIAVRNKEKPSYSENVLTKIKKLDQLTLHITIPSASQRNCVNELDLNQMDIESSDNE